jgi:hypothetical protein
MGIGPMPRYPTNGRFMRENDSRSGGGLDDDSSQARDHRPPNEQDFPRLVELAVPPEGFGRGFLDFDASRGASRSAAGPNLGLCTSVDERRGPGHYLPWPERFYSLRPMQTMQTAVPEGNVRNSIKPNLR